MSEPDERVLLAMVLTREATAPDPLFFVDVAAAYGVPGLTHEPSDGEGPLQWSLPDGGRLFVMAIDAPHPDAAAMPRTVTSPDPEMIAAAGAHIIVTVMGNGLDTKAGDGLLARLTAAVCNTTPAIGAMLSHGVAFHRSDVFAGMVKELGAGEVPVWVSIDITLGPEPDGRVSALTHGMSRYGREDFYVLGTPDEARNIFDIARMMSTWMATSDKVLPTGDTVGRTPEERLTVQRVPSPMQDGHVVVKLEL